jgi:hypothetical protein
VDKGFDLRAELVRPCIPRGQARQSSDHARDCR